MEQKNIILGIIVILVIVFGVGIYFYRRPAGDFKKSLNQGRALFRENSKDSITLFQKSLQEAKTPQTEALAKLNLGVAFLLSDPTTAVRTLKQVAENESYPPVTRSFAIAYIVDIYNGTHDVQFASKYIFAESEPWITFLKKAEGNLFLASRSAYEWANQLYPLSVTRYRVALWYITRLLSDREKPVLTDIQRQVYLDEVLNGVKAGDELMEREDVLRLLTPLNRTNFNLIGAINYTMLYLLKGNLQYKEKAESKYAAALSAWNGAFPEERSRSNMGPRISLFYAGFISLLPEEEYKNRMGEVRNLINSALEGDQRDKTLRFLKSINRSTEDPFVNLMKKYARDLAKIDEKFADLLREAGWSGI